MIKGTRASNCKLLYLINTNTTQYLVSACMIIWMAYSSISLFVLVALKINEHLILKIGSPFYRSNMLCSKYHDYFAGSYAVASFSRQTFRKTAPFYISSKITLQSFNVTVS